MDFSYFHLFFSACKKGAVNSESIKVEKPTSAVYTQIANAKAFFEKDIQSLGTLKVNGKDKRRELKKTPNWKDAFIIHNPEGDIVTVPLTYDRHMTFQSSFSDGKELSLNEQTKLMIFTDKFGKMKSEVVTYFPDKAYLAKHSKGFSGIILVEDWAGNQINKYLFKDGKRYRFNGKPSTANGDCIIIHWFLCDVTESGVTYNCEFVSTEYMGSCNEGLEPCLESCGSTYIYNNLLTVRPRDWQVVNGTYIGVPADNLEVRSYETLIGVKENGVSRFTGIDHNTSALASNMPGLTPGTTLYKWQELSNTKDFTNTTATVWVSGKIIQAESVEYFVNNKYNSWQASDVIQ